MHVGPSDKQGAKLISRSARRVAYRLKPIFTVGRSSRCDLVIKNHRISRHHAEIRSIGSGQYCVLDVGSRNGTFVNGERVAGSRVLSSGDELVFGDLTLTFVSEEAGERPVVPVTMSAVETTDVRLDDRLAVALVSDIRGYTALSERHGKDFQAFVAEWFRTVVALVRQQSGVVDKIHGDGILAYWWVEERTPEQSMQLVLETCDALMQMRERFAARLRAELKADDFKIGIGVHMGNIMLGNLGSGAVHAFTAVGDTINLTFRIEELTKLHGRPVLVSEAAAKHAPPGFTLMDLGEVSIRGRSGVLNVYSLEGCELRVAVESANGSTEPGWTEDATEGDCFEPEPE